MNTLEQIQAIIGQNHICHIIEDDPQTSVVIMHVTGNSMVRVSTETLDGVQSEGAFIDMLDVMVDDISAECRTIAFKNAEKIAKEVFKCNRISLWVDSGSWMKRWYQRMGYETIESSVNEESRFEMMRKDLTK